MTDNQPSVYLAGPIANVSLVEASLWREKATKLLAAHGIVVRNPLDWECSYHKPIELVESDLIQINQCTVLLAYMPNVLMCGTPMEIVYAGLQDISVVSFGRYKSPWKTYWSDYEAEDLEDAIRVCVAMIKGEFIPEVAL